MQPMLALAITAGMFLPAFAFSLLFYERLEAAVEDARLHHFLQGVAAAVVGLIAVTLIGLARSAQAETPNVAASAAIILLSLLLLYRWQNRLNTLAVICGAAAAGMLFLR